MPRKFLERLYLCLKDLVVDGMKAFISILQQTSLFRQTILLKTNKNAQSKIKLPLSGEIKLHPKTQSSPINFFQGKPEAKNKK